MTTGLSGRIKIEVTDKNGKFIRSMYGWIHEIINDAMRKGLAAPGWSVDAGAEGKKATAKFTIEGSVFMRLVFLSYKGCNSFVPIKLS